MEIIALTLDIIGKVMVAYTALAVHRRVRKEHKIDKAVFYAMKREQLIGITGIIFMVLGYILHIFIKL
ncbi:MAG: hypothetical protein HYW91_00265 [Candidatus Sungbacteria bacterium]|nr:hypothetical protein [Candidatus Sungbacteria bacterium]